MLQMLDGLVEAAATEREFASSNLQAVDSSGPHLLAGAAVVTIACLVSPDGLDAFAPSRVEGQTAHNLCARSHPQCFRLINPSNDRRTHR